MKLRTKFSALTSFLVILVVLGFSIILFISERKFLVEESQKNQMNMVRTYANACRDALLVGDEVSIASYVKHLRKMEGIIYAKFVGGDEKTITSEDSAANPDPDENVYLLSFPVVIKDIEKGKAGIAFSKKYLRSKIEGALSKTRERIFVVGLLTLIGGIFGALFMAGIVTNPLRILMSGARLIGEGNLDERVKVKSKDEIGELADEFNMMAVKLKELDQMKQDFISNITHELRHPLSNIESYINIMRDNPEKTFSQKEEKNLESIISEAFRLSKQIDDLLEAAKIERGKLSLNKTPFNLTVLAHDVWESFKIRAEEKQISLENRIIEELTVCADQELVEKVFSNLLSNAMKYTPKGGKIVIGAEKTPEFIKIYITDTGIGIPKDDLIKIFDKFEQVRHEKEALYKKLGKIKGIGLGLAICKGIVEGHGGKIWAESTIDKGSTFYFTLPAKKSG